MNQFVSTSISAGEPIAEETILELIQNGETGNLGVIFTLKQLKENESIAQFQNCTGITFIDTENKTISISKEYVTSLEVKANKVAKEGDIARKVVESQRKLIKQLQEEKDLHLNTIKTLEKRVTELSMNDEEEEDDTIITDKQLEGSESLENKKQVVSNKKQDDLSIDTIDAGKQALELEQIRQENKRLKEENHILRKTTVELQSNIRNIQETFNLLQSKMSASEITLTSLSSYNS